MTEKQIEQVFCCFPARDGVFLFLLTGCLPKQKSGEREMAQGRITKRAVDALECPSGKDRVFLWDDALAGFGVGAFPTGKKVYVAQYRQNGRSRRVAIGE